MEKRRPGKILYCCFIGDLKDEIYRRRELLPLLSKIEENVSVSSFSVLL